MNTLPITITAGLERIINHVIDLDEEFPAHLQVLHDKIIAIHITDFDICLYLIVCSNNSVQLMSRYDGVADASIKATSFNLTRMGMSERPNDLVLSGDVVLDGDVHLAKKVRDVIARFQIDWEEHLSKLTGDVVAHQVGNAVKDAVSWGKKTLQILSQDVADYVVYEKSYVPTKHEMASYVASVDVLRNDVDRVAAKIQQLEQHSVTKKPGKKIKPA